jgi:hypothetical protein
MRADLAIGLHPEHPCHEVERSSTSSRPTTFDLAGRRASPSLSARLVRDVKMPRLRFYNQRSRHEHSISTPPLETVCQPQRASPLLLASRPILGGGEVLPPFHPGLDAGPPRGHPASSGCMLDGTPAGFGSIDCPGRFRALRESSGAFSAHRTPCRPTSSGTSSGDRYWSL